MVVDQWAVYCDIDEYGDRLDQAYEVGEFLGSGEMPFEVEVKIVGGSVVDMFSVKQCSMLRIDVFVFDSELERQKYLDNSWHE